MKAVVFKPELRTPGGESTAIYEGASWVGDLHLLYRENDRLTGTVQIDTTHLSQNKVETIMDEVKRYIAHLSDALNVQESSVSLIYGDIESILELDPSGMDTEGIVDPELEPDEDDTEYFQPRNESMDTYDLRLTSREGTHTKYNLVNDEDQVIGVVSVDEEPANISGRVDFWIEPDDADTDDVAKVLVNKFSEIDPKQLSFTMTFEDEHVGDMHVQRYDY